MHHYFLFGAIFHIKMLTSYMVLYLFNHLLFPVTNLMLMITASLFANCSLSGYSEENLAFTALSSQHALPQDLSSGQVSLFSLCTATRLWSNGICKKERNDK